GLPSPSRFNPPYRRSGLYRAALSPEDQAVIDGVRDALTADCGGADNLSTARRLLIDLAAAAAIRCQRVNAYLATLDSLVDKKLRRGGVAGAAAPPAPPPPHTPPP